MKDILQDLYDRDGNQRALLSYNPDSEFKKKFKIILEWLNQDPSIDEIKGSFPPIVDSISSNWGRVLAAILRDKQYEIIAPDKNLVQQMSSIERSVIIYHDVHVWDVIHCIAIAKANIEHGVQTTACLLWDFTEVEKRSSFLFDIFKTPFFKKAFKIGFHDSPIGRQKVFIKNNVSEMDLASVVGNREMFLDFVDVDHTVNSFDFETSFATVQLFSQKFDFSGFISHHGDAFMRFSEINGIESVEAKYAFVWKEFYRKSIVSNRYLQDSGFKIFNEQKNKNNYIRNLIDEKSSAFLLINHPLKMNPLRKDFIDTRFTATYFEKIRYLFGRIRV